MHATPLPCDLPASWLKQDTRIAEYGSKAMPWIHACPHTWWSRTRVAKLQPVSQIWHLPCPSPRWLASAVPPWMLTKTLTPRGLQGEPLLHRTLCMRHAWVADPGIGSPQRPLWAVVKVFVSIWCVMAEAIHAEDPSHWCSRQSPVWRQLI